MVLGGSNLESGSTLVDVRPVVEFRILPVMKDVGNDEGSIRNPVVHNMAAERMASQARREFTARLTDVRR